MILISVSYVKENLIIIKKVRKKVKDHDHYTGIYRGAAHSTCNFRYSAQRDIPVVIHNGSKYDFHLIIKELAEEFRSEIHCIPEDKESTKHLVFQLCTEQLKIMKFFTI